MSMSYISLLVAFVVLLVAFGVLYYTNTILLKGNADLFARLQACEKERLNR